MNDTLSALTAFVGFLIGFSMMVQAVQEAMKNCLSLKGGVWERFFINLYKKEFGLTNANNDAKAKLIGGSEFVGDFKSRLERASQIIIKVDDLLKELKKDLLDIVEISPSNPYAPQLMLSKIEKLSKSISELTGLKIESLLTTFDKFNSNAVKDFSKVVESFPAALRVLTKESGAFSYDSIVTFQKQCQSLLDGMLEVEDKILAFRVQIGNKLDAWLAQLNGEYKRHMLKWTVITGALMVLATNADSFAVYKHLSADPKIQQALIQNATDTMERSIETKAVDINGLHSLIETGDDLSKIREEISEISNKLERDFKKLNRSKEREETNKMRNELQEIVLTQQNAKELLIRKEEEVVGLYVVLQKASIDYFAGNMASLDLPLGGWGEFFKKTATLEDPEKLSEIFNKIFGLLLTTFLVTFGAPFWNNVLTALLGMKNAMKNK